MKRIVSRAAAGITAAGLGWALAWGLAAPVGAAPVAASPQTPFPAPIVGITTMPPIGMVQLAGGSGSEPGMAVVSVTRVCNVFNFVMSMDGCAQPNPIVAGFDVR